MKKKKNWLTRLMISYLPVYLLSTSAIIIFLFVSIVHSSRNDLSASNRAFVTQIRYLLDDLLNRVDRSTVRNLCLSPEIRAGMALDDGEMESPYYSRYRMFREIQDYMIENSDVSSVCLYLEKPRVIISDQGYFMLEDFYDRTFVEESAKNVTLAGWSGVRESQNPSGPNNSGKVVSLVRTVPGSGLVIVNIPVYKLEQAMADLNGADLHYAEVRDTAGNMILSVNNGSGQNLKRSEVISEERTRSGWVIEGKLEQNRMLSVVEISSYVWIAVSIVLTILGAISIHRQNRKNYAPLAAIVEDIQGIDAVAPVLNETNGNEFHLISRTIQTFNDIVGDYRHSKRVRDFLLGKAEITEETDRYGPCAVCIVELDKHTAARPDLLEICERIQTRITETWTKEHEETPKVIWLGWMTYSRLAVVVQAPDRKQLITSVRSLNNWIIDSSQAGAVAGIGETARGMSGLATSYQQACAALEYKIMTRNGEVMEYTDRYAHQTSPGRKTIQAFRDTAEALENLNPGWEKLFDQWNERMSAEKLINVEVLHQYRLLSGIIDEWIHRQPAALQSIWDTVIRQNLNVVLAQSDYLSEIQEGFRNGLRALVNQAAELKNRKQENQTMISIERMIENHFTQPEFSLGWVADTLKMNPNYISTLIREETGSSFTRIVNQKRTDRAKDLLRNTNQTIGVIAERVGFQSAVSFNRVFKQAEGMTPGEYRKQIDSQNEKEK